MHEAVEPEHFVDALHRGADLRIAIARALLKDAPILVLDEPTEGLDAVSECAVLLALDRLMVGRTTLLVTHRPQALCHVDAVLRLERGARDVVKA